MRQMEIQYFFPLTEQIPLDLIYEGCDTRPKVETVNSGLTVSFFDSGTTTGIVSITAGKLNLDVDTTVIKVPKKPNLCRRTLLKCLGLKWEVK
jgi:hypothetical protein